jgi:hypothetical protein
MLQWIHSLWLKVGKKGAIPATTLERLALGDKYARIQTRERSKRFQGNEPTILLQ